MKKESNLLFLVGLAIFLGAWLIYDKGLAIGLRQLTSYAYLVALFYLSASAVIALIQKHPLHKFDYILGAAVLAIFAISMIFSWPGIKFLTVMILVCGAVLGTAIVTTSRFRR